MIDELQKTTEPAVGEPARARRPSWWRRLFKSRFLFISIAVHLLFGLGAAVYVVQRYQGARKLTFKAGPPSPNRSTRSIEHKVQLAKQKTIASAPAVKRIVSTGLSRITLPAMPAMPTSQATTSKMSAVGGAGFGAPAAMGSASGSSGGGGGPVSLFGLREATRSALVGTFYDLKQTPGHRSTEMDAGKYDGVVKNFIESGWSESTLSKYYRAPQPLYATQIMIPQIDADAGPKAFGVERAVQPRLWVVLYRGRVSPPESGTYHFVGAGDDILFVRFNKKTVLERGYNPVAGVAKPAEANYQYAFAGVPAGFAKGEGITVEVGTFYEMEVLVGEEPGGKFFADLLIQKDGASYDKDSHGNPIFPRFRTTDVGVPTGVVGQTLPPFTKGGPIWRAEEMPK